MRSRLRACASSVSRIALNETGAALAKRFGCEVYRDLDELLDTQDVDFAFVFGRHIDMPVLAGKLIARGIPFAIEKPCGIHARSTSIVLLPAQRQKISTLRCP